MNFAGTILIIGSTLLGESKIPFSTFVKNLESKGFIVVIKTPEPYENNFVSLDMLADLVIPDELENFTSYVLKFRFNITKENIKIMILKTTPWCREWWHPT